jgi:hypothetical protein
MTKPKSSSEKKTRKPLPRAGGSRKPVDLEALRQQISRLVGNRAMHLVGSTIAEADKGHYGAMKYLFEIIGLYPASEAETPAREDSLARTLLQRLGVPEDPEADAVTKATAAEAAAADKDTVE